MKLKKTDIEVQIKGCEEAIKQMEQGVLINTIVRDAFKKELAKHEPSA
jgi:hypothetical protein